MAKITLAYSDQQIEHALKAGDEKVFESLFRTLFPPLTNYAFGYLEDRELAKEQVQECFIAIWNRRHSISFSSSVVSYLYIAVRNRCISQLKSKYQNLTDSIESITNETYAQDNLSTDIDMEELSNILESSVNGLSEKTRIIFQLSREEELSYSEIAEKMSISVKTVEFHISSALKKIRADLKTHWHLPVILLINLLKE